MKILSFGEILFDVFGDSFCATFLVNYLRGDGIADALQKASRVSAWVVSQEGAIPEGVPQL